MMRSSKSHGLIVCMCGWETFCEQLWFDLQAEDILIANFMDWGKRTKPSTSEEQNDVQNLEYDGIEFPLF